MANVFQIIDESTVSSLELHLEDLFVYQGALNTCDTALLSNPSDAALISDQAMATSITSSATTKLQAVSIKTTDLIKSFKDLDEPTIRRSNDYYAKYGADYLVENLAWSANRILNTCEDSLRDKVREGLVGVSDLESGGPLVLKKILDIVMLCGK